MPGEFNSAAAAADICAAGPVDIFKATGKSPPKRKDKKKARKSKSKKSPPFVVELLAAEALPAADVGIHVIDALRGKDDLLAGSSDPYVVAWLSYMPDEAEDEWEQDEPTEQVLGSRRRSATKLETTSPVWRFHTDFGVSQNVARGSILNIEIYDEDLHSGDDLLASVRIPVNSLLDAAHTYPLELGKSAGCLSMCHGIPGCETVEGPAIACPAGQPGVTVRRVPVEPGVLPEKMVLFLVEHGESVEHKGGVADLIVDAVAAETLDRIDYPMSSKGIQHVRDLAKEWQLEEAAEETDGAAAPLTKQQKLEKQALDDWMKIDRVFSSPMTRAVQSSLLLMEKHPSLKKDRMVLLAAARDIKTGKLAGHHTGVAVGAQGVTDRALDTLRETTAAEGSDAEVDAEVSSLRAAAESMDGFDSLSSWWTPGADTDTAPALAIRFHEFLGALRYYRPGDSRVAVSTHSHFIMRFLRHFTPETYQLQSPRLKQMCTERVHHGSVVAIELHFREGKGTDQCSITSSTPLFSTFSFKSGGEVAPHRDLATYKGASYHAVKERKAASVHKKGGLFSCCCGGAEEEIDAPSAAALRGAKP